MQFIQPEELSFRAQIKNHFLDAVRQSRPGRRASELVAEVRKKTHSPEIRIQSVFLQLLDEGKITVGEDLLVRLAPTLSKPKKHYRKDDKARSLEAKPKSRRAVIPAR